MVIFSSDAISSVFLNYQAQASKGQVGSSNFKQDCLAIGLMQLAPLLDFEFKIKPASK